MRDFLAVASEIVRDRPGLLSCLPAIEKELLHVEILRAMHEAGHLRRLAFKGGTCLRLCHGGVRFSEDLDFSGGADFDHRLLQNIEEVLRARIGRRYGLQVTVASPKLADGKSRSANRWVARVVTRPVSRDSQVGVQRIKIEIDDRDAQPDVAPLPIRLRHALIAEDFVPFPVRAASMSDICSDKLIAYPMSVLMLDNPRHRDVWDIVWLSERLDDPFEMGPRAAEKAIAWGAEHQLRDALQATVKRIHSLVESDGFLATLNRFIPRELARSTLGDPQYRQHVAETIRKLCGSVLAALL